MTRQSQALKFAWWNLHNFRHYDPTKAADTRWPKRRAHYEAKRERVLTAFDQIFRDQYPDLIAVCEITRQAADDLVARLPPGFRVVTSPTNPRISAFQVAIFFRAGISLTPEPPLIPEDEEDVAEGTRPMIPIHLTLSDHLIRFVACHWTAFEASRVARERLADILRRDAYAFLKPESPAGTAARHIVILGDLNEEPMSAIFEDRLIGRRDRRSAGTRHRTDANVRRIRLYNAAWRYLGEQVAHGADKPPRLNVAGTYFKAPFEWRTVDHVLVSSGLLGSNPPYLDEASTGIVATAIMLGDDGLPRPFSPGSASGVSDHLPIVGRLVL